MSDFHRNQVGLLSLPGLDTSQSRGVLAIPALRPWLMRSALVATDLAVLFLSAILTLLIWEAFARPDLAGYIELWPLLAVFTACYAASGLYAGTEVNAVLELKRCTTATCLSFAMLAIATFLLKQGEVYSRAAFLLMWAQAIVYIPLARQYVRRALAGRDWWGHAAVVIGSGELGRRVIQNLQKHPEFGLKPVAVLDETPQAGHVCTVPVTGGIAMAPVLARAGVRYVIIAQPELSRAELLEIFSRNSEVFIHTLLVPDMLGVSSLWVEPADLGGVLSLRIKHQLLLPGSRLLKAAMDRGLSVVFALAALPVIAAVCLFIKASSPGPVFYSQRRLGRCGEHIRVWKFRTMVQNADKLLDQYLENHPEMRREWESEHKLRNDPRVTAAGRFLRRTSLDELPQIWNVIKGEMSLVGPRPIVDSEIVKYGKDYDLYKRVTPGITGLWQVSGRNDVAYGERVGLDVYYVRNWSVWLDLYILAQTVRVVLFRKGAY